MIDEYINGEAWINIPYETIGGVNLTADGDITGSGGTGTGDLIGSVRIAWSLPGGINNTKYNGLGVWARILEQIGYPTSGGRNYYVDEDIIHWLEGQAETEEEKKEIINAQMQRYVVQLLKYTTPDGGNASEDPNSFEYFKTHLPGCWYVV